MMKFLTQVILQINLLPLSEFTTENRKQPSSSVFTKKETMEQLSFREFENIRLWRNYNTNKTHDYNIKDNTHLKQPHNRLLDFIKIFFHGSVCKSFINVEYIFKTGLWSAVHEFFIDLCISPSPSSNRSVNIRREKADKKKEQSDPQWPKDRVLVRWKTFLCPHTLHAQTRTQTQHDEQDNLYLFIE